MSTATTKTSTTTATRLAQYALAAAALPAAAASGAVVSETFQIPISVSNGNSVSVDFGPQFGEVFRFTFSQGSDLDLSFFEPYSYYGGGGNYYFYRFRSFANAQVNFNRSYNNQGASNPPRYAYFGNDYSPGVDYSDPVRFGAGQNISYYAGLSFGYFGYFNVGDHDLFRKGLTFGYTDGYAGYVLRSGSYGNWLPGDRGFMAFEFFASGGRHFGFFDLSIAANGNSLLIHGWSFNDVPGGGVSTLAVPSPGAVGLGALAMGAAGIRRQRRDRATV